MAALKMELARRDAGDSLRPTKFSPGSSRSKTDAASSAYLNDEEDESGYPSSNRWSLEEAGDIEVIAFFDDINSIFCFLYTDCTYFSECLK